MKSGIEALSGMSMDNIKVHYNSAKPARLNALAYAQGTDIHVAPGQEQHLPHEAWHVVQQAHGRVQPTMQITGAQINDDVSLEKEADVMGARALQMRVKENNLSSSSQPPNEAVIQGRIVFTAGGKRELQTNFVNLWRQIGGILKSQGRSVYNRRKTLKLMHEETTDHDYVDGNDLVTKVYGNYDPPKMTGRVRPNWDSFWSSVSVPSGYHRRHIILSSLMRKAIYKVTDENSHTSYLISAYQKLSGRADLDINVLEATLVSAMHNNKFNIFLGKGNWNSAIGALANASFSEEAALLNAIALDCQFGRVHDADDKVALFWEMMATTPVFGQTGRRAKIAAVYKDILDEAMNDIYAAENGESYEAAYNYLFSMLRSFYDSMAFDLSQSSHDEYRKAQNSMLFHFHEAFFNLTETGDLLKFVSVFQEFMALEQVALQFKGQLGDSWKNAITQPS